MLIVLGVDQETFAGRPDRPAREVEQRMLAD